MISLVLCCAHFYFLYHVTVIESLEKYFFCFILLYRLLILGIPWEHHHHRLQLIHGTVAAVQMQRHGQQIIQMLKVGYHEHNHHQLHQVHQLKDGCKMVQHQRQPMAILPDLRQQ